jgi:hypothetical protein
MKGFLKSLLVLSVMISAFGSYSTESHAADPAGWQLIDTATIGNGTTGYLNGAEGGNAKICLTDAFGGANVTVYDDDGNGNWNVIKSYSFWDNNECWEFDVDPYVDGTDNDAEFVVTTSRDIIGDIIFELWD